VQACDSGCFCEGDSQKTLCCIQRTLSNTKGTLLKLIKFLLVRMILIAEMSSIALANNNPNIKSTCKMILKKPSGIRGARVFYESITLHPMRTLIRKLF
jgi:hypothetical protein